MALVPRLLFIVALPIAALTTAAGAVDLARGPAEQAGLSAERLSRLDRHLDGYVDDGRLPGYQVMIARNGQVVHHRRYGLMDVEAGKPMREDTIFRAYSMSKPITGAAVMIAMEKGLLRLDDPVSKYLPELKAMKVVDAVNEDGTLVLKDAAREITILDLATHTSGFTYHFIATVPKAVRRMYVEKGIVPAIRAGAVDPLTGEMIEPAPSLEAMITRLAETPLIAEPGTEWNYSVGMDVLGRVIEVVSDQTFDAFLREELFAPLGMTDTAFQVADEKLDRFAANYGPLREGKDDLPAGEGAKFRLIDAPQASPYRKFPRLPSGGGALVTTMADYMRFAMMLTNGGELEGVRVLSRKSVDLMMADHLPGSFTEPALGPLAGRIFANGGLGMGFGITGAVVTDKAKTTLPISDGIFTWGGAASTYFWADREERLAGLFMTQLTPSSTYPLRPEILILTYQAIAD